MTSLNRYWDMKTFDPSDNTFQRISERMFGVELEYDDLPDNHCDLEDLSIFGAKGECTVEGGEFVSPILSGDLGLVECEIILDFAYVNNFLCNYKAGFHLHLDMGSESGERLKRAIYAYRLTEPFWKGLVDWCERSRQEFCDNTRFSIREAMNISENVQDIKEWGDRFCRYSWLNVGALRKFGTLEIRHHESTTCANDVTNWVIAHTAFIDAAVDMSIGQITRVLGEKTPKEQFPEIRRMLQRPETSEHLASRYNEHYQQN